MTDEQPARADAVVNDPTALLAATVAPGSAVLLLGGDGVDAVDPVDVVTALVGRGCLVSAVVAPAAHPSGAPEAAEALRGAVQELVVADLATSRLSTHFKPATFDVVVAGAPVLALPGAVDLLRDAAELLGEGGRLVLTAPHSAHGGHRLRGLLGREPGVPGLLTPDALGDLVEAAGLALEQVHASLRDALHGLTAREAASLPSEVVEWVRHQPGALHHTLVVVARAADPDDVLAARPDVTPALPAHLVRAEDEHSRRVAHDREERHRMLTVRDHVLGLEASLASADTRVQRARLRAQAAHQRARRLREQLDDLLDDVEILARSRARREDLLALVDRHRAREVRQTRDEPRSGPA